MGIKAIVTDIDGTLLTDQKIISEKTKQSLIDAQKRGIKLILASGRPTTGIQKYVEELEMKKYGGYIVSFNGSCVIECATNKILFEQAMSVSNSKKVLEHMKAFDVIPMIDKDEYLYVNNVFNNHLNMTTGPINIIEYEARGGEFLLCEKKDLAEFVDFPLNKILVAGQPEYLQKNHVKMMEPFKDELSCMFTAPVYFEFTDKNVDKAKALQQVFPHMGIEAHEMISFGDGHNDQSIIEYAGIGIAMGNAVSELKEAANDLTLTNNDDGIVLALEKYLG